MQHVTGFAATGRYLNRDDVIKSTGRSPLVPKGKHTDEPLGLETPDEQVDRVPQAGRHGAGPRRLPPGQGPQAQRPGDRRGPQHALESAEAAYQQWPLWLREKTIDYVIPMSYTDDTAELSRQIAQWKKVDPSLQRIIPGLSIYEDATGKAVTRNLGLIRRQHALCQQQGTHGSMYFSHGVPQRPAG